MFYAVHEKDVKSCEIVVINVGLMHVVRRRSHELPNRGEFSALWDILQRRPFNVLWHPSILSEGAGVVLQGTLHEIRAVDVILNIESMKGSRNDLIECNSEEICEIVIEK
uniref:SFRICE_012413 n=1 Tax=Spodoptera frugiperda TaxID=7108 RepID=A0A2H1WWU7_SPOFR